MDFLPPQHNSRIVNELEEDSDEEEEEERRGGRGAEVAPPTDMEYYGATQVGQGCQS